MIKAQNKPSDQDVQNLVDQLNSLASEAEKINKEIKEISKEADKEITDTKKALEDMAQKAGETFSELDNLEKEANDELDRLMLRRAEELAEE